MIKNLLFDFGGVLLDLDYEKTYERLEKILHLEANELLKNEDIFKELCDFECGKIIKENLMWTLQRNAKKSTPHAVEIIKAWNAMLVGWNIGKFDILEQLSNEYNLYLLSNTNEIHIEWVYRDLKKINKYEHFRKLFSKGLYYSHELGFRKPNKEIFEKVLELSQIKPEETLFIEDTPENLIEAEKLGFKCHLQKRNDNIDYLIDESFINKISDGRR
jgi:putative hydrolase of the HAD superfamily